MDILIVDDNPMMCRTLADIFIFAGYAVETAFSGREALEKFQAGQYSCVISDIKMPEMNGVELFRALKKFLPSIWVVLITAYATDDLVQEGMREGALAVINKPFNVVELLDQVSNLAKKLE